MHSDEDAAEVSQDPLEGADVGETKTVKCEKTLHEINYTPNVFFGSDRLSDYEVTDSEVLDNGDIKITWEGNVTKRLTPRWDSCNEPRTEEEYKKNRRKKLFSGIATVASTVLLLGLAMILMDILARQLGAARFENQVLQFPTGLEMVMMSLPIFLLAIMIMYGLQGGFPRMNGGVGR